jgi:hypothetical protein
MVNSNKKDFKTVPLLESRKRITVNQFLKKMQEAIDKKIISGDQELEYISIDGIHDTLNIELADWYQEPIRKEDLSITEIKNLVTLKDLSSDKFKEILLSLFKTNSIHYLMAWIDGEEDNGIRIEYEDEIFEQDLYKKTEL